MDAQVFVEISPACMESYWYPIWLFGLWVVGVSKNYIVSVSLILISISLELKAAGVHPITHIRPANTCHTLVDRVIQSISCSVSKLFW
jgi:hypothetical protein